MRESVPNASIQPVKLAKKQGEIRFHWPVSAFERMLDLLFDDSGEIEVVVRGRFDDEQRCLLETDIKGQLRLTCQTSYEPIDYPLETTLTYCALAAESQIQSVEAEYECLVMDEGFIDLQQVIEDELILSLPLVANKAVEELTQKMQFGELPKEANEPKQNPFSVLANLKKS